MTTEIMSIQIQTKSLLTTSRLSIGQNSSIETAINAVFYHISDGTVIELLLAHLITKDAIEFELLALVWNADDAGANVNVNAFGRVSLLFGEGTDTGDNTDVSGGARAHAVPVNRDAALGGNKRVGSSVEIHDVPVSVF